MVVKRHFVAGSKIEKIKKNYEKYNFMNRFRKSKNVNIFKLMQVLDKLLYNIIKLVGGLRPRAADKEIYKF